MPTRFRQLLQQSITIIVAEGHTSTQIANISKEQLAAHLDLDANAAYWSGGNLSLFTAVLSHLVAYKARQENKAMAESIRDALTAEQRQYLRDNAARYVQQLGEVV